MIAVLSEESTQKYSVNARETQAISEAARMFGCRVYTIPATFAECGTAENALAYVPEFEQLINGVWVGAIPTLERYQAIYDAALTKQIQLVNSPSEHQRAMEFDLFYPLLGELTPRSLVIRDLSQIKDVSKDLSFPVFVKGAVKSNKDKGLKSVVANNIDELSALVSETLANPHRSRGKVIIRDMIRLKSVAMDPNGFPIGREYRAFLHHGELLTYGFYWEEYDDIRSLSESETRDCIAIIREAARRVGVPYLSVDVGQLENGSWTIIEVGDGQFSGLSQVPVLELWNKVKDFRP